MQIRTEILDVTPQLADEFLKANTRNRNISRTKVKQIRSDIEHDNWELTHQGIAFYESGELADGQTRLTAVKESGRTVKMSVTYGLPITAGSTIDRHRPRSDADSIKIGGLGGWIGRDEIAVIKMIALAHQKSSPSYSAVRIAELGKFMVDPVTFACLAFSTKKKHITTSPVLAALAMAKPYENEYRLLEFAEVMLTGVPQNLDDLAAIRLREHLMADQGRGGQTARRESLLKTQRAIKAFAERDRIQKLYTPKELIYRVEGIEEHL